MHVDREGHFHCIRVVRGAGDHAERHLAFASHSHLPVHTAVLTRSNGDRLAKAFRVCLEAVSIYLQGDFHLSVSVEIIVRIGTEHHFVLFHEKAGSLQSDQKVLAGDDFGFSLADASAMPHAPDHNLPGGQVVGHRKVNLGFTLGIGFDSRPPKGGVCKLGTHCELGHTSLPAGHGKSMV